MSSSTDMKIGIDAIRVDVTIRPRFEVNGELTVSNEPLLVVQTFVEFVNTEVFTDELSALLKKFGRL